jgi:hypothetical protein
VCCGSAHRTLPSVLLAACAHPACCAACAGDVSFEEVRWHDMVQVRLQAWGLLCCGHDQLCGVDAAAAIRHRLHRLCPHTHTHQH